MLFIQYTSKIPSITLLKIIAEIKMDTQGDIPLDFF
jgi:hypothetical protein